MHLQDYISSIDDIRFEKDGVKRCLYLCYEFMTEYEKYGQEIPEEMLLYGITEDSTRYFIFDEITTNQFEEIKNSLRKNMIDLVKVVAN